MERPVLTAIILSAVGGALLGTLGTLGVQRAIAKPDAPAEPPSEVVEATGAAVADGIDAAQGPAMAQEATEREIATSPVQAIYAEATVAHGCIPVDAALSAYSIAVGASQGQESSAAVNAEEAQADVSKVLTALLTDPDLCSTPE